MATSDSEVSDFEGFTAYEIQNAEHRANIRNDSDISVSSIDDSSDFSSLSDDGNPQIGATSNWTKDLSSVTCHAFTGPLPGPTTVLDENANELDFLNLLFSDRLYEYIALQTNNYAQRKMSTKADPLWRAVTKEDIKAYMGVQIISGIVPIPKKLYFTKDPLLHSTGISERFTRDRLDKITKYFQVGDTVNNPPRGAEGHDKLSHIRSVMDHVKEKCMSAYNPHPEVCVDEAMIAYTGRLGFKQYISLETSETRHQGVDAC